MTKFLHIVPNAVDELVSPKMCIYTKSRIFLYDSVEVVNTSL